MDKKIVGLVGAISGLMSLSTAQATALPPTETALPSAQSFGELLDPIPNAAALLRIADAAGRHTNPNVKLVGDNHHHHHTPSSPQLSPPSSPPSSPQLSRSRFWAR